MAITLKDVAEHAGVSRSAVSRTFTEGASVSAKTRDKVMASAEELNYRPNFLARGLSTSRTKLIGLVLNIVIYIISKPARSNPEMGWTQPRLSQD